MRAASARAWTGRARRFWEQRQRRAPAGALTGYLLDESPPAVGRNRFNGEWAQVRGWLDRHRVGDGACLDLGCGTGAWLRVLAPRFKTLEGWDYAPSMIRAGRRTLRQAGVRHARLVCGDITRREGRACFDLIFVGGVLMYTPDAALPALLRTLRRLLKPDGLIILRETTLRKGAWAREGVPLRPGSLAIGARPSRKAPDYVAVYRGLAALRTALLNAGFEVKAVRPNPHYKLSDLTEDWLWRLKAGSDPSRAERLAVWIHRARWILLYPEYFLRRWTLENHWFLAGPAR